MKAIATTTLALILSLTATAFAQAGRNAEISITRKAQESEDIYGSYRDRLKSVQAAYSLDKTFNSKHVNFEIHGEFLILRDGTSRIKDGVFRIDSTESDLNDEDFYMTDRNIIYPDVYSQIYKVKDPAGGDCKLRVDYITEKRDSGESKYNGNTSMPIKKKYIVMDLTLENSEGHLHKIGKIVKLKE